MSTVITSKMVMDLRKRTGVGMSKCKEALVEANADLEEAILILRKKGMATAVKKGGRETNEGVVQFTQNDKTVFIVEFNAETDFVIQNDRFKEFTQNICDEIKATSPRSLEEFLKQSYSKNSASTVDEYRAEIVLSLGENIQIKRILELPKKANQSIGVYSHSGGKIVTAAVLEGCSGQETLAREVGMHIAAESPEYLSPEDVPSDIKTKEEEVARSQVKDKPPQIQDKIIEGKMRAYFEQVCLNNQKYVKDPSMTVAGFVESQGKKEGKTLKIIQFIRWQIGG